MYACIAHSQRVAIPFMKVRTLQGRYIRASVRKQSKGFFKV